MRASSTRSQLAVLTLIWLVGGGLWFAPPPAARNLRGTLRDMLIPGQRAVLLGSARVSATWQDWRSSIADGDRERYEDLRREAELWRERALRLQVQSAELTRQLEAAGDPDGQFPVAAGEPLLLNRLIEARILGTARPDLEARLRPIIDRGSTHEVDVDDIVLADDQAHLDQGFDAGIDRDNLVLSGVQIVGRIEDVGRWTSTIQTVTDEKFRGAAQLVREGLNGPVFGAEGILAGNGDGTCRLELIAAADPVAVGDTVFLPGHRTGLAGSVYYGRVIEATLAESAAYWSITVVPRIAAEPGEHLQVLVETANPRRLVRDDSQDHQPRGR